MQQSDQCTTDLPLIAEQELLIAAVADQPMSVRLITGVIADAPFPMFILIGETRRLVYNSAYIPILGPHHPSAMGRPFFEVWPEVRDVIEPAVDLAFAGEATRFEDLPVTLHRPEPGPAWFTFSYSPVRDESGAAVAALCVCTETTRTVIARERQHFMSRLEASFRNLQDAEEIVMAAQALLGEHFGMSRVGYGSLDPEGRYFTTSGNWTDGSVPHHNGTHDLAAFGDEIFSALRNGVSLAVEDTLTDPRAQGSMSAAAFAALQVRSAVTVSLIKDRRFVAALYLHHQEPRRWTAEEVDLIQEVAERTWSAVERAHAQADLRALAERQGFFLELGDELRPLIRAEQIKETAARLLGRYLRVGRAGYGEIDAEQRHVTVERDWSNGHMASLAGETRSLDVFGPAIIAQLKAGKLLRIPSVADDAVAAPYAAGYASIGATALLIVPLIKEGRLTAILYLHEAETRMWTDEEAAVALGVAERTWAAVERARAEDAVRQLNATLERRVGEALAERRLFAEIVAATDSPIQMIGVDYRFLAINPAGQLDYERVFGVRPQIGQSLLQLLSHLPEQCEGARKLWARALAGESFQQRAWWGDSPADRRAYDMHFEPVRGASGEVTAAYLIGRDVTDLLREQERLAEAEEQLRHAQKMEAMGQLTGGVAHDFNNLLTPIVGSLDILQRRGLGGEREQRLIAGAAQSAERAKVLVQRLLAFARRQPLQPSAVDLGSLVHGMADLIASTAGPQIKVAVEVADDLPPAHADHNQLEMALLNLAVNARDAMPDGGMLRISVVASEDQGNRPEQLMGERYLKLSVADTGVGMDEATLARAIEPFFSTKGVGQGTGLGLSMAHGLASQLGGALTIQSHLGVGTNVQLWLPISGAHTTTAPLPTAAAGQKAAAGIALVVDDEDLARMTTAAMLSDIGYDVVEAASAEQAMKLVEQGLSPDLLVTDHLMPGKSGTELARDLIVALPQIQVLIVSGYAELDEIAPDLRRLVKPFRSDELAAALDEAPGV
ncbi:PAS domain-containing protein [Novosphingobium sp. Chol11]|jgi:signal transduction histidine kinase/CheY-like chemotaxis protein|uniref:PAS domain-containing protein n=1 Tax=Novosphingobium sp. Chol11 TaxID=1385763 RepID=UPI000BE22660|nr:PAS domain-containing protein [Novosphingobium sp. Chol11]